MRVEPRIVSALASLGALLSSGLLAGDWRQFRGTSSDAVGAEAGLPLEWSATKNVAWRTPLPGRGVSSPIVVGERVIVTSSDGYRQDRLHVLAVHRETGERRWERRFWATGPTFSHPKTCGAAPTPASDGERIFALFSSNDLVCLDLEGNLLWLRGLTRDYPNASNSVGMASSPLVVGGTLVVQVENDTNSFAAGLDALTGVNLWKIARPASVNWTSPTAIGDGRERTVVLQSREGISGHEPAEGRELWKFPAECDVISSCAVGDGFLVVPSRGLTALRPRAPPASIDVIWESTRMRVSTASPVVYDGKVYAVSGSVLKCAGAGTGEVEWQLRLEGPFSSSPVANAGYLYLFNEDGLGHVVRTGKQGEIASRNALGEGILATPAIAGGALFVRSDAHLWKIASER
jgi:outer membrane protein assembly factor BamB